MKYFRLETHTSPLISISVLIADGCLLAAEQEINKLRGELSHPRTKFDHDALDTLDRYERRIAEARAKAHANLAKLA